MCQTVGKNIVFAVEFIVYLIYLFRSVCENHKVACVRIPQAVSEGF